MQLTTEQQILIEQRVANEAKSTGAAYLLWLFMGTMGVHRLYLGRTGTGATMLVLFVLSIALSFVGVGLIGLLVLGIWAIIDAFLIPGMIRDQKNRVRQELMQSISLNVPARL